MRINTYLPQQETNSTLQDCKIFSLKINIMSAISEKIKADGRKFWRIFKVRNTLIIWYLDVIIRKTRLIRVIQLIPS